MSPDPSSFRIQNYMAFRDSGENHLSQRMNIIVGQNNSGKTAFLRAIAMRFNNDPHRDSFFPRNHVYDPNSTGEVEFVASGAEIRNVLLALGETVQIPASDSSRRFDASAILHHIFDQREVRFKLRVSPGPHWANIEYPSHQMFRAIQQDQFAIAVGVTPNRAEFTANFVNSRGDNIGTIMGAALRRKTYFFDAQRLNVGRFTVGNRTDLESNAANLPEVLLVLQHNRRKFDRLNEHLREVFPTINSISVRPAEDHGSTAEIKVWSVDPATERDDLAIPLNQSGTGIGQVIAILYVLLASDSNIIVIDEPNSFLHPSASRQLVTILRQYPNHQYVISTHSPETIAGARPERLFVLRWQNEQTHISVLPGESVQGIQEALMEVGSRLSDVFGADAIVWVEGPTEEACFPRILRTTGVALGNGISIVALRNTGDLEAKRASAEAMWDVYRRLSQANSLMPRALAFSLDREGRNDSKIADLQRLSNGLIKFLPRRMFENYLIHGAAIAALLNRLPAFQGKQTSAEIIEQWINANGDRREYFLEGAPLAPGDPKWRLKVHSVKLLVDLFAELSNARESYQKVAYGVELTDWILEHDRAQMGELVGYLTELIPAVRG